jgi:hypothetical protein
MTVNSNSLEKRREEMRRREEKRREEKRREEKRLKIDIASYLNPYFYLRLFSFIDGSR